jgi:hypothetical protein
VVLDGVVAAQIEAFEVAFVDDDGDQHRRELTAALSVPFESCRPVRRFASYKGQRHLCGQWWTATTGSLVGYESWLERDRLVLLDFDLDVVGIASQPFRMLFVDPNGKQRSQAPDYFARLADGSALVLDCRPANRDYFARLADGLVSQLTALREHSPVHPTVIAGGVDTSAQVRNPTGRYFFRSK